MWSIRAVGSFGVVRVQVLCWGLVSIGMVSFMGLM